MHILIWIDDSKRLEPRLVNDVHNHWTDAEETDTSEIVETNKPSVASFSEQSVKTGTKLFLVYVAERLLNPTHLNKNLTGNVLNLKPSSCPFDKMLVNIFLRSNGCNFLLVVSMRYIKIATVRARLKTESSQQKLQTNLNATAYYRIPKEDRLVILVTLQSTETTFLKNSSQVLNSVTARCLLESLLMDTGGLSMTDMVDFHAWTLWTSAQLLEQLSRS